MRSLLTAAARTPHPPDTASFSGNSPHAYHATLRRLGRALPRTHFYSPHDLFCDGVAGHCGPYVPGTSALAIYDRHHLSDTGSLYLWPHLCAFLWDAGLLRRSALGDGQTDGWR